MAGNEIDKRDYDDKERTAQTSTTDVWTYRKDGKTTFVETITYVNSDKDDVTRIQRAGA